MTDQAKRTFLVAALLAVAGIQLAFGTAEGHSCTVYGGDGVDSDECNAHYCPPQPGLHHHYHDVPWWYPAFDHYCENF